MDLSQVYYYYSPFLIAIATQPTCTKSQWFQQVYSKDGQKVAQVKCGRKGQWPRDEVRSQGTPVHSESVTSQALSYLLYIASIEARVCNGPPTSYSAGIYSAIFGTSNLMVRAMAFHSAPTTSLQFSAGV